MSTATDTENQITNEINSKKTLLPVLVSQAVMIIFYKIMLTDIKLYLNFPGVFSKHPNFSKKLLLF